jgi:AcrR family transcriptional regulator
MTEKQEKILNSALELFAQYGYANTSTSKIAKHAGVSEGLIFRHFGCKESLLDAIVGIGVQDMQNVLSRIRSIVDPEKILIAALNLPQEIIKENPKYWKVQMSLKFQSPEVARKYHESPFIEEANNTLTKAFDDLEYENPTLEAQFMLMIISSFFMILMKEEISNYEELMNLVKSKYDL